MTGWWTNRKGFNLPFGLEILCVPLEGEVQESVLAKFSFTYLFQVPFIAFPPLRQVLGGKDEELCRSGEAREHGN